MLNKILHFIQYNNAAVIILAIVLIVGGGAFAAGPEVIGERETSIQGVDNTVLLAADLETLNMDFKIENVQQDEKYYYVTYSFLDLVKIDNAWQYQLNQKTQKVSKKIKQDIGEYMAKFMAKHFESRVRGLKEEKSMAESQGEQKRVEVTEYSGLIGKTLDIAATVFPGYEPVVKIELPTPENFNMPATVNGLVSGGTDNLNKIYNDYVAAHPEVFNTSTDPADSSTEPSDTGNGTSDSSDTPEAPADSAAPEAPAVSETPAIPEPDSVEIIDLPAPAGLPISEPVAPVVPETAPAPTPTPAPEPAPAE